VATLPDTKKITVTKMEAARRQLRVAIEMWFNDGDAVATHTLARAAYQLIHDLNRRAKGAPLLFDMESLEKVVKDEFKSKALKKLKEPSDFSKHADRGRVGMMTEVTFAPDLSRGFMLFAILGLRQLGQELTGYEIAFALWHFIHRPHVFHDAGKKLFEETFSVEEIDTLRHLPKREFLAEARTILWGTQAQGKLPDVLKSAP
jgi:hypothetical protein